MKERALQLVMLLGRPAPPAPEERRTLPRLELSLLGNGAALSSSSAAATGGLKHEKQLIAGRRASVGYSDLRFRSCPRREREKNRLIRYLSCCLILAVARIEAF